MATQFLTFCCAADAGHIPKELAALRKLEVLLLASNRLTGEDVATVLHGSFCNTFSNLTVAQTAL